MPLLDWNIWSCSYLFPPNQTILKVLGKMADFRGIAYIVVPVWHNQAWFPLLISQMKGCHLFPDHHLSPNLSGATQKFFVTSRVDFLREAYQRKFSINAAEILVQAIQNTSRRQYQTGWKAFTDFLRKSTLDRMMDEIVLSFIKNLFIRIGFSPTTVSTYKSALSKPLLWPLIYTWSIPSSRTSTEAFSISDPQIPTLHQSGI